MGALGGGIQFKRFTILTQEISRAIRAVRSRRTTSAFHDNYFTQLLARWHTEGCHAENTIVLTFL